MLTLNDCMHFTDLAPDEVDAIAENRHIPVSIACSEAWHLASTPRGRRTILRHLVERLEHAEAYRDWSQALRLRQTLRHFTATHHYV